MRRHRKIKNENRREQKTREQIKRKENIKYIYKTRLEQNRRESKRREKKI